MECCLSDEAVIQIKKEQAKPKTKTMNKAMILALYVKILYSQFGPKEQKRVNREIDRQLRRDKKDFRRELTLVVLGVEESGKSTLMRCMRIFYGDECSDEELRGFAILIYQNIFMDMQAIIRAMELLNIQYSDSLNKLKANQITAVDYKTVIALESNLVEAIKALWEDVGIQECYSRRKEYQITESAKYFLSNLDRISSSDYLPVEEDIIRVKEPTIGKGITDYPFKIGPTSFRMVDFKGQRYYRKWLHYFEHVNSIIFVSALNDYDQLDSYNENRMEKSKELFRQVIMHPYFQHSNIILFLNKKDVFDKKIMHSHLVDYFPDYDGPQKDGIHAREFILRMFVDLNPDKDKIIYSHYTCLLAINLRFVMAATKEAIMQLNVKKYNLV